MQLEAEVTGKYDHAGDASRLLYTPLETPHTCRHTRRYTVEFEGPEERVVAFLRSVLVDDVSQELHVSAQPALNGHTFILDYGFKPGALDLEKETIEAYYRGVPEPGFTLKKLKITQRLYIYAGGPAAAPERFVKDIVNPAVHSHRVLVA